MTNKSAFFNDNMLTFILSYDESSLMLPVFQNYCSKSRIYNLKLLKNVRGLMPQNEDLFSRHFRVWGLNKFTQLLRLTI